MDYEDLRKYHRMERNSPRLAPVEETFYDDLGGLVKRYRKATSEQETVLLGNVLKVSKDILERREQKIVMQTLRTARTKEPQIENMIGEEKMFFNNFLKLLKESRDSFKGRLEWHAQKPSIKDIPKVAEESEKPPEIVEVSEDLNTVLVRIIKKVPKFVSSSMKEMGPFEVNDIVKLPRQEAELLSERNFIEVI